MSPTRSNVEATRRGLKMAKLSKNGVEFQSGLDDQVTERLYSHKVNPRSCWSKEWTSRRLRHMTLLDKWIIDRLGLDDMSDEHFDVYLKSLNL